MMDCPKHSLEHCLIGLFGWINPALLQFLEWQNTTVSGSPQIDPDPSTEERNIAHSDKLEENGSSLAFFHMFTFFSLTSSFQADLFGPWGVRSHPTHAPPPPPPLLPTRLEKHR